MPFKAQFFLHLVIYLFTACWSYEPGCTLYTNKDIPEKNDPLYLIENPYKEFSYLLPESNDIGEHYILLNKNQRLLLACPGYKNYLNNTKNKLNIATCLYDNKLLLDGREYNSLELHCQHRIFASVRNTNRACFDGTATLLEVGFELNQFGWHKELEICHAIELSRTYYVKHKLYGASLKAKIHRSGGRPNFNRGPKYLYKGFNPDIAYSVHNQEVVFDKIFGLNQTNYYIDLKKNRFMARGHLAPDADFIYPSWQLNTYFYINTAPQWQSINGGNWLDDVEFKVRELAIRLNLIIHIYTGNTGILKLNDENGNINEIYLEENSRLPVPEYFWKIVHNPKDNSCLGVISTNNPYIVSVPAPICTNVCNRYRWYIDNDEDLHKGFVYCCEYGEMKDNIPEVPELNCIKPLYFPRKRPRYFLFVNQQSPYNNASEEFSTLK